MPPLLCQWQTSRFDYNVLRSYHEQHDHLNTTATATATTTTMYSLAAVSPSPFLFTTGSFKPFTQPLFSEWQSKQSPERGEKSAKTVRFQLEPKIAYIIHIKDMTQKEKRNLWHSKKEYLEYKLDANRTLELMRKCENNDDGDDDKKARRLLDQIHYTERGLECCTKEQVRRREEIKLDARVAVLEEQQLQKITTSGDDIIIINNAEWVAALYHQAAYPSQVEAQERALQDEQEVYKKSAAKKL